MKKIILTISILFLLVSLIYTNVDATQIIIGNNTNNNTSGNSITNSNTSNNNTNNNTTGNNTSTNNNINSTIVNKVNNTLNKTNTVNSSYRNTNLPDTGSEDFVYGFIIVVGIASAVYAYIKIKMYNI